MVTHEPPCQGHAPDIGEPPQRHGTRALGGVLGLDPPGRRTDLPAIGVVDSGLGRPSTLGRSGRNRRLEVIVRCNLRLTTDGY